MRQRIDAVDGRLAESLAERAALSRRVALWKTIHGQPLRHPSREAQVRRNYAARLAPNGWPRSAVSHLMDALLDTSRRLQAGIRVAIQGGRGSWSEESLLAALPDARVLRCATVGKAWAAVRDGRAAGAWLAARNSTTGDIEGTREVRAAAEAWLERSHPVRHALLARTGLALADVRRVAGHPQALQQCRRTLARLAPRARLVATVDGAHTARSLRAGGTTAVLASPRVATRLGLRVLHDSVVDDPGNATTFQLLVPRQDPGPA